MSFPEKLAQLREELLRKQQAEKERRERELEKKRKRAQKEARERERKRQEEERRERKEKLRIEQRLNELRSFVDENIQPYLEEVDKVVLASQGTIWRNEYGSNEENLQIRLSLNWDVSSDSEGQSGKSLSLRAHANGNLKVIAGDHLETEVVIDTNVDDWQKELEEVLLSKLSSEEVKYYHAD